MEYPRKELRLKGGVTEKVSKSVHGTLIKYVYIRRKRDRLTVEEISFLSNETNKKR